MTSVPPPQGMSEVDYEAIEAAVTETVRGRWFLAEFARRNRITETRQLLDAMARIEAAVAGGQVTLPSADPSIRLLIQRIKEIAGQLGEVAGEMRVAGVDDHFVAAVDLQARAVAAIMRNATPPREALPARDTTPPNTLVAKTSPAPVLPLGDTRIPSDATRVPAPMPRLPRVEPPSTLAVSVPRPAVPATSFEDPRIAALSGLDGLTLAKKLALFS